MLRPGEPARRAYRVAHRETEQGAPDRGEHRDAVALDVRVAGEDERDLALHPGLLVDEAHDGVHRDEVPRYGLRLDDLGPFDLFAQRVEIGAGSDLVE